MSQRKPAVIAIDGPGASGKGTLAKKLAERLGFDHLDTGLLYRAVGLKMLKAGLDPSDEKAAASIAESLAPSDWNQGEALRGETVAAAASVSSSHPPVRAALLSLQQKFCESPPGGKGAVLDGRDIGTVVWPAADLKLFVTADARARASRRHAEALQKGQPSNEEEIYRQLCERDQREATRAASPVRAAPDAVIIDTTSLSAEQALGAALAAAADRGLISTPKRSPGCGR